MPELRPEQRRMGADRRPLDTRYPHARLYGPHVEPAEPPMVTIRGGKGDTSEREVPVPQCVLDQRRQLNQLAYEQSKARAAAMADTE